MLIFSEKKVEVDDIHEYLLLKGVQAVSIHGGKGTKVILYITTPLLSVGGWKGAKVTPINNTFLSVLKEEFSFLPLSSLPDQEERQWAIREYREGKKDVLVATDIASKGLDFPNIQHIINYDMPADIENYGV